MEYDQVVQLYGEMVRLPQMYRDNKQLTVQTAGPLLRQRRLGQGPQVLPGSTKNLQVRENQETSARWLTTFIRPPEGPVANADRIWWTVVSPQPHVHP